MKERSFLIEIDKSQNKMFHVQQTYLIIANLKQTSTFLGRNAMGPHSNDILPNPPAGGEGG